MNLATATFGVLGVLWVGHRLVAPRTRHPVAPIRRWQSGRIRGTTLAAAGAAIGVLAAGGPTAAAATAAVTAFVRAMRLRRRRRAAERAINRAVPDVLDTLVCLIGAGLTPQQAVDQLAMYAPPALQGHVADVVTQTKHGARFADALEALNTLPGAPLRPLVDGLSRGERYGDPIAPVLERLADDARRSRRDQMHVAARQLPVRLCFPLATCTLPAFVVLTIAPLLAGALSSISGSFG